MIYLDNAATSYPKPKSVLDEITRCLKFYCGNPGRSSHKLSLAAADKIYEARESIAGFLQYEKSENIIFVPSATFGLNMVIKGLVTKECHCIISDLEHNSVIRPLAKTLKKLSGSISVFDSNLTLKEAIIPLIKKDTRLVISTLCSNVTGKIINFKELSQICRSNNLKLIIDASQYLGHIQLDLKDSYFTAICCAGHKNLFGIQGSAFTVINDAELFDTLLEGGTGIDTFSDEMPIMLPERYEAGTMPTPAIVSLGKGINFINEVGMDQIEKALSKHTNILRNELTEIRNLTLYGADNGIAAFNLKNIHSSYISKALDKYGICTRSGFHCAPLIHKKMGTEAIGAIRVSLSYFNTETDIYKLVNALKKIQKEDSI